MTELQKKLSLDMKDETKKLRNGRNFTRILRYDKINRYSLRETFQIIHVCSSVDRAMPSGGMCGGSNPPRCVIIMEQAEDKANE